MANGKYGFDFLVIVERLLVGSLDGAVGEGGGGRDREKEGKAGKRDSRFDEFFQFETDKRLRARI